MSIKIFKDMFDPDIIEVMGGSLSTAQIGSVLINCETVSGWILLDKNESIRLANHILDLANGKESIDKRE